MLRTKCPYFQYKYAIQLATLKHSQQITFVFSAILYWWKALIICTEGSWLGLISPMRLDDRKPIQHVMTVQSIFHSEQVDVLPSPERNNKGPETNKHRHAYMFMLFLNSFKNPLFTEFPMNYHGPFHMSDFLALVLNRSGTFFTIENNSSPNTLLCILLALKA